MESETQSTVMVAIRIVFRREKVDKNRFIEVCCFVRMRAPMYRRAAEQVVAMRPKCVKKHRHASGVR